MTTTTIRQRLQDLSKGLEADKALLAKANAIEVPPSLAEEINTPPAPAPTIHWLSLLTGTVLGAVAVAVAFGLS